MFLEYLSQSASKTEEPQPRRGLSDQEMEVESQMATDEIMKVFDDLRFQVEGNQFSHEMMEIDF